MNDENTGFAAFALYNALHLHFTSNSYDYFRYNGKTNISKDSFARRKDKFHFYRLSRRYKIDELREFYIANFVDSSIRWVGDISSAEGEDVYKKWQKRNQSLTYNFEQDIIHLMETENWLKVNNGQYPYLLEQAMQKGIGWRKALRAAIADNTFVKGDGLSPRARRELLGHSQLSLSL